MRESITAELLVARKRTATWIMLALWLMLAQRLPTSYRTSVIATRRAAPINGR